MAHVREYPHESSCGRPSSRTNFSFLDRTFVRWIQWFCWFRTVIRLVLSVQLDLPAFFFTIEIWTSVMFSWSTFGLWWVACRMAFWTWCSSRRSSIQFELAMDLILRLRVGRAAHQLFFVDVTVFMREQSEKREVRKSSTATEQETTPKCWSQTVQATRRGCQTDRSKLHTPPAAIAMINSPIEQKLQFSVCKTTRRFAGPSQFSCVLKPSFTKICIRISLCKTSLLSAKMSKSKNFSLWTKHSKCCLSSYFVHKPFLFPLTGLWIESACIVSKRFLAKAWSNFPVIARISSAVDCFAWPCRASSRCLFAAFPW